MIKFERVSKRYKNGVVGLRESNINIENGEFVFLIGSSGAGKSTFVKLILKEIEPNQGKIYLDGEDITNLHRRKIPYLRRKMGVVFQDFRLLPKMTVYQNVAYALEIIGGIPKRKIRSQVNMVLGIVGLHRKSNMRPHQLSGGEKQRVSIARAIINNPKLLIADEPTGNLDPETSWEIMKILRQINRRGTTVIMITHDKEVVDIMKKRVIELKKGKVIRDEMNGGYGYEG
ncbi:MAG TPA: cell division ATP-binding protein FtsE [Clostridia bacterium]|jgi:cell division transport system ATP-binding protein|nr:cell division ATP-binding protein FtsE [Clostridia bacterium]